MLKDHNPLGAMVTATETDQIYDVNIRLRHV